MNAQVLKQTNVTRMPSAPTLKDRMSVVVKGVMLVMVKTAQVKYFPPFLRNFTAMNVFFHLQY